MRRQDRTQRTWWRRGLMMAIGLLLSVDVLAQGGLPSHEPLFIELSAIEELNAQAEAIFPRSLGKGLESSKILSDLDRSRKNQIKKYKENVTMFLMSTPVDYNLDVTGSQIRIHPFLFYTILEISEQSLEYLRKFNMDETSKLLRLNDQNLQKHLFVFLRSTYFATMVAILRPYEYFNKHRTLRMMYGLADVFTFSYMVDLRESNEVNDFLHKFYNRRAIRAYIEVGGCPWNEAPYLFLQNCRESHSIFNIFRR